MISCAHLWHLYLYWQFQTGKERSETQILATASRLSHHISMLLSRKGCLESPKSSPKIHHRLLSTWGTSYWLKEKDRKMPRIRQCQHQTSTSGWITTKITSIWNWWFFCGGFCSTTFLVIGCLHEIQAVTSNSWPSQDPATLVVLVNVIPSDAFQVDNGTLSPKEMMRLRQTSNLEMNSGELMNLRHSLVVWLGCLEFYWIYFWIKLEGVCRLAGWTLLVESETTKPNHQIICWESKHHASYVAE